MNRYVRVAAVAISLLGFAACDSPEPAPKAAGYQKQPAAVPERPAPNAAASGDRELSDKVKSALTRDQGMEIGGVDVAAADGVVTINGTVEMPAEKHRAAMLAMGVYGVRSVVNNLVVIRGS